jgi:trans-aconitate 2-methyltransferase
MANNGLFYRSFAFSLVAFVATQTQGIPGSFFRSPLENKWDGQTYTETANLQIKWANQFFFEKYQFRGDENVLDVGSGNGKITQQIHHRLPRGRVVGIDNSPSMLQSSRENYPHLLVHDLNVGSPDSYKDFENQFDLVVSFHTLHWVPEQEVALQGIHRSMKKNGKAYLRLSAKGYDPIQEIADEMIRAPAWARHFTRFQDPMHRYSIPEYSALLEKTGFRINSLIETRDRDELKDRVALYKQIKSWLPHSKHLGNLELESRFLNELITTYLVKHPPEKGAPIILHDCYFEVVATK